MLRLSSCGCLAEAVRLISDGETVKERTFQEKANSHCITGHRLLSVPIHDRRILVNNLR
jgi:hypothetical protein